MDWFVFGIWVVCLSPVWGAFLLELWEGVVRPRLIARTEILSKADELWKQDHERAFDIACTEEHRAWHYCDSFEQGRWKRIRVEIMRRERARGAMFRKVRRKTIL